MTFSASSTKAFGTVNSASTGAPMSSESAALSNNPPCPAPPRHLETRRSRLHARQSECARRLAPAVEIRLAIQRRDRHQNRLNCSGARPPTCVFRSAASVRAPGVQSSAVMKGRTLATERVSRPTSSSRSVR